MKNYSRMTRAALISLLQSNETSSVTGAASESQLREIPLLRELKDLKAALDAHSIVAITDPQGKITFVNDKFCEISKYSRSELLGKDHRIINSGSHSKEFFKDLWSTISSGKTWKGEICNRAKDETLYWVYTTIFPFMDTAGKPMQYIAIRTDITERKRDEEKLAELARRLEEKNKDLETIFSVASHDLRSPLVNIQGFSQELEHSCVLLKSFLAKQNVSQEDRNNLAQILNEDIPEAIQFVKAGVSKIDSLLAGLLKFSRQGRAAIHMERLDMNAMLKRILQAMEFQIKETGTRVTIDPLPDCVGDSTQINQVFSNLLDNALKYLDPKKAGMIHISAHVHDKNITYSVRDNGIGIMQEHQKKIFEIFHRLNPSKGIGEGLGLTISQRILERHHGKIHVESTPGMGSTFFVSLPK
ncbi:MAG: ATP-binding protein [Verrucomicrobiota bacterium]